MDQKERKFKVFEIEEEEPDFSDIEKSDLSSFALSIEDKLEEEGWIKEKEENIVLDEPITDPINDNEHIHIEKTQSIEKIPGSEIVEEPVKPFVPDTIENLSDLSDKLAVVMGYAPVEPLYNQQESEIEKTDQIDEPEKTESAFEIDKAGKVSEFKNFDGAEIAKEIDSAKEVEKTEDINNKTIDANEAEAITEIKAEQEIKQKDEFFDYFSDFKLSQSSIPDEIVLNPRDDESDFDQQNIEIKSNGVILKSIMSWILTIAVAFVMAMFINIYIFRPSEVSGSSMIPTLHDGDTVIISRVPYILGNPQRGDIIVIDSNTDKKRNTLTLFSEALRYNVVTKLLGSPEPAYFWIKRVIGIPGDVILFESNCVYRNGEELNETYINESDVYTYKNGTTFTVNKGEVFVMGDNRNHSTDSRSIGLVPVENIIGKMIIDW